MLHSALDAIGAGYGVHLPLDAVGGRTARTEAAVIRQMERAGGVTTSMLSLITRLEPDRSKPPGSSALEALRTLRAS